MFKVSEPYQITKDDEIHHHFFGYYAISPWCADQSKFLCLRTDFQDHYPKPDDQAQILLLDLENPKENPRVLAKTKGFNLQQGAMLHWLPGCPNRKVVYNEVRHGKVVSLIKDIGADEEAVEMPMGINAMAHGENVALCVSFERLRECRKVCSYASVETNSIQKRPKDDGVYIMDLNTGEVDMILSLQDVWGACRFTKSRKLFTGPFWFNHVVFSPDNSRFSFLSRFRPWFKGYYTSMWTCGLDGKTLFQLVDYENRVSHFEWLSPDRLMATAKFGTNQYFHTICRDQKQDKRNVAPNQLTWNGHIAKHPRKNIIATDTYVIEGVRYVYLVDLNTEEVQEIAKFSNPRSIRSHWRCDPHPRWSPDGKILSFDGLNKKGNRQIFFVDVDV